jgi:hypothetical protein
LTRRTGLLAVFISFAALAQDHAARIGQIDQAATPALPAGFKGMIFGYLDDSGPVY